MPTSDNSLPPAGPTIQRAFDALVETFAAERIHYAIIGRLAVIQHTRIRTTDDIDALISVTQPPMPGLFEALGLRGFVVDVVRNVRELRDEGMTSVRFEDVSIDLLRPLIPAYTHVLDRAMHATIRGKQVSIGSPEGLIVTKLIAMRPQDEADIQEIFAAYAGRLDLDFIRAELDAFAGPDDPRHAKLTAWSQESRSHG